jgi:hypothetical protein
MGGPWLGAPIPPPTFTQMRRCGRCPPATADAEPALQIRVCTVWRLFARTLEFHCLVGISASCSLSSSQLRSDTAWAPGATPPWRAPPNQTAESQGPQHLSSRPTPSRRSAEEMHGWSVGRALGGGVGSRAAVRVRRHCPHRDLRWYRSPRDSVALKAQ